MVSPDKTRAAAAGFSNLQDIGDAQLSDYTSPMLRRTRGFEKKYSGKEEEEEEEEEEERLRRVVDYVKQSLEPFYRAGPDAVRSGVPAAETIRKFLERAAPSRRIIGGTDPSRVDLSDFRKCLFALGVSSEDTAFLLESLDRKRAGALDSKVFAATFLPGRKPGVQAGGLRRHLPGYGDNNDNSRRSAAPEPEQQQPRRGDATVESFHRRVLERVLVKYANVKDAFRQYDTNRAGVLTTAQLRVFLRDLGFVGGDAEALIRHLDEGQGQAQHAISFNAFARGAKLSTDQSYARMSPKRKVVQPLRRRSNYAEGSEGEGEENNPIERIRAKLRQRVIGRSKSIREVFVDFDADGNGRLDHDEFKQFMAAYGFAPEETRQTIEFLDKDVSGTIDYDEFAGGLLFYRSSQQQPEQPQQQPEQPQQQPMQRAKPAAAVGMTEHKRQLSHGAYLVDVVKEKLWAAVATKNKSKSALGAGGLLALRSEFDRFAADGTGALKCHEFAAFLTELGITLPPRDLEALMLVVDKDASNQIEFHEFASAFGQQRGAGAESPLQRSPGRPRAEQPPVADPLEAVFSRYDVDCSGQLDYGKFSQLMRDHGFAESEIINVMTQIDCSSDGGDDHIDLETFKTVTKSREWRLATRKPTTTTTSTSSAKAKAPVKHSEKKKSAIAQSESQLIARMLRDHQSLEATFHQHDLDGSGELEHDEFRRFMKHYGLRDDAQIDQLIASLDNDASGTVSLDEFMAHFQLKPTHALPTAKAKGGKPTGGKPTKQQLAALQELKQAWAEEVLDHHKTLESAFRQYDSDGRDELDYEAFRDLLSQYGVSDDRNICMLLSQADVDGSGTITLDEFLAAFRPLVRSSPKNRATIRPDRRRKPQAIRAAEAVAAAAKPSRGLAAHQANANAVRLRLLEEQWVTGALDAHGSVRAAFDHFDADGSGELDHGEFTRLLAAYGITREDDVASTIRRLDLDNSGAVDYEEFATLFNEKRVKTTRAAKPSLSLPVTTAAANNRASHAARLRELEIKWIKRALSCHPSIEAAFGEYDRDGNGALDHDEFAHCMKRYGIVLDDDIARLARRLDLDGSGTIDLHEFTTVFHRLRVDTTAAGGIKLGEDAAADGMDADELGSVLEIERELAERILKSTRDMRAAFRKFDLNGNGKLEYVEFRAVLKAFKFPEPEIRKVIRHLDRDVSGFIDYREFISGFSAVADTSSGGGGKRATVAAAVRSTTSKLRAKPSTTKKAERSPVDALRSTLLERVLATYGTVQSAFRKYDTARNGSLAPKQFEQLMADLGFAGEDSRRLLADLDADRSGTIEYEEFLTRLIVEPAR